MGGCINVLDERFLTLRNTLPEKINKCTKKYTLGPMLPCCSLWVLRCCKHSGSEESRRGKNWKSECRPDMIRMVENHIDS